MEEIDKQNNYQFLKKYLKTKEVRIPTYEGSPKKPMISFLVNIAWGNEYIPEIIRILNYYNIKLTFFLEGRWISKFPQEALNIKNEGHEIGNHAYSHPDMRGLSENQIQLELRKTNEIIKNVLNIKPLFFTPPYGYINQTIINAAAQEDMFTILWSLDTLDWKIADYNEVLNRIIPKLKNGAIILMHPTESSVKALPHILERAINDSYKIVTISQLIAQKFIL
ncbi:polysaccharide deacetylase family protein [Priestia megaterium]|uniref:polysaccharide deacetylase family protein n=1 Tax=Priestia megaterium TaxID=1404 RepID=UPI0011AA10A2|nr:polysaccharide deacetylase family protein [Priestia megaterium]